jgi:cytoskeletal protein CcmA (bactofilin family)
MPDMLWERKSAVMPSDTRGIENPEGLPLNVHTPKKTWSDNGAGVGSRLARNGTVLGHSVTFKGELSLSEDLLIEGQFEGKLSVHDSCVTIGPDATVRSDICAGEAIVLGAVEGNISAQHRIEIRKSGRAVGDLTAPGIVVESGAYFKGRIEVLNQKNDDSQT